MSAIDSNNSEIFSLRIVSIDNYMRAPLLALDACYSEFRGDAVKQVPVIRVFGTDSDGSKTCAHIHGVFPYLYVPYAGGDSTHDIDRLTYQLATGLDKAINISLGQANSTTQHVFKIVLVKAKPFYGFHKSDHQFVKIFFYNPAFIRRAANLLQNGAILGKVYQPHEAHVPYILQFMIDFNLYGMSFLYTPLKLVRYRQQQSNDRKACESVNLTNDGAAAADADDGDLRHIDPSQILDRTIERMSTSKQEIDLNAATILNRFQVATNEMESEYANPGIAFLWSDERSRRSKLHEDPPSVTKTQDRGKLPQTDSENFHQAALNRRLEQLAVIASTDDSLTQSSDHSKMFDQTGVNRKFDLNQFLHNSVYPSECTQADEKQQTSNHSILDASFLIDHTGQTGRTSTVNSRLGSTDTPSPSSKCGSSQQFDPNETFVDEDLILSLTQRSTNKTLTNETLNENEHEVLDIFELMEHEDEESSMLDDTLRIDEDSALAPLSQRANEVAHSSQPIEKSVLNHEPTSFADEEDSDDDLLNQFSMSIIDCLPDQQKSNDACDEFKIPQLDGAFSPTKKHTFQRDKLKTTTRSPPKSSKKYAPLDIVITKSPAVHHDRGDQQKVQLKVPKLCLEKCDANISSVSPVKPQQIAALNAKVCEKNNCINSTDEQTEMDKSQIPPIDIKVPNNQQYSDILRKPAFVKLIKYENIEEEFKNARTHHTQRSPTTNCTSIDATNAKMSNFHDESDNESFESSTVQPPRRYPVRERKPRTDLQSFLHPNQSTPTVESKRKRAPSKNDDDLDKLDTLYSWYNWSDCKLAQRYDNERKFFPQPGPSNLNYYEDNDIVGYYRPVGDSKSIKKVTAPRTNGSSTEKKTPPKLRGRKRNGGTEANSPMANESMLQTLSDNSDWEDDIHVQSLYEQSFAEQSMVFTNNSPAHHSPLSPQPNHSKCNGAATTEPPSAGSFLNTTISTPVLTRLMENLKSVASSQIDEKSKVADRGQCKITPLENTPNQLDIMQALDTHKIPKVIHSIPYYSDPIDILAESSKKEIGHTVLQLHGNAVNDCAEFQSELNVNGLAKWQRKITLPMDMPRTRNSNNKMLDCTGKCRTFLAKERTTKIAPNAQPPKHSQAHQWLTERTIVNGKKRSSTEMGDIDNDMEHSAKVQRQNSVCDKKNQINMNNNHQCRNTNDVKENGSQGRDVVSQLLSKKELTVTRITRSNMKKSAISQTNDQKHRMQMNNNNNSKYEHATNDDDNDDDVICLSDMLPTKQPEINPFCQVGGHRKIHLK